VTSWLQAVEKARADKSARMGINPVCLALWLLVRKFAEISFKIFRNLGINFLRNFVGTGKK